jgi:UDP-N-acetylglucosamine--dolichyl-phosphate N-acetylglucosaminephosphotransferase
MLGYFATDSLLNGHPERYQYSAYLLLSFIASALALMKINAYPAQIFIGDTFCYFAGIVLAIAAVYGTFSGI